MAKKTPDSINKWMTEYAELDIIAKRMAISADQKGELKGLESVSINNLAKKNRKIPNPITVSDETMYDFATEILPKNVTPSQIDLVISGYLLWHVNNSLLERNLCEGILASIKKRIGVSDYD